MFYLSYEIFIFVFILLSAFFSGTETAIISVNRMKLKFLADKGDVRAARVINILNSIENAVGMTLVGNNIVNVASAAFVTFVATKMYLVDETSLYIITIIQTIFFLVFCEILPKLIARSKADAILMFISRPVELLMWLFMPAIKLSLGVTGIIKNSLHIKSSETSFVRSRDEIGTLFKLGVSEGVIDQSHNEFIRDILRLHEITVIEVMTPIVEIVSIEIRSSIRQLVTIIENTRFSRIPVYINRVDDIAGYVYYRDIMNRKRINSIEAILYKPYFVPATKRIDDLFLEMQKEKLPMVFVVNEFGGVEGLVTIEDIVEEIVGEIHTRDHPDHVLIEKINKRKFILRGSVDIDFFNREFGFSVQKKGFETIAGYMSYHLGRIPVKGDRLKSDGFTLVVEESNLRSVEKVILTLNPVITKRK
ncbi:MAG TPA: hemolysin family protein [Spirochaetota bacterium]|nr:hemolysin family protein [Spirochaetota bacterium]HPJ37803.1 hemolysin family protein [Spirochaetota bacterium]HPQ52415.1 hemolysin family protein [Spirochaetota bacterium]